jgi:hypothetical protein
VIGNRASHVRSKHFSSACAIIKDYDDRRSP